MCAFFIDDIFYVDIFSLEYKNLFKLEDEQFLFSFIKQAMNIPYAIESSLKLFRRLAEFAIGDCIVCLLGWGASDYPFNLLVLLSNMLPVLVLGTMCLALVQDPVLISVIFISSTIKLFKLAQVIKRIAERI